MQKVRARGGELFVFADLDSHFHDSEGVHVIRTPRHVGVLSPVVHAIPVQLLAYHAALARGSLPVVYQVERIRDGGSFSTRRVYGDPEGPADLLLRGVLSA